MYDIPPAEPVTITIAAAVAKFGLGRTKLYELIQKGEIASYRIGRRRLISFASLKSRLTAPGTDSESKPQAKGHRPQLKEVGGYGHD